jgi:hypothetical protein
MSSVAKRVLERMNAMLSEKNDQGQWVVYNRVAGFVVTGNEDGAHHVINEMTRSMKSLGHCMVQFNVPKWRDNLCSTYYAKTICIV